MGRTSATFKWGPPTQGVAVGYRIWVSRNGGGLVEVASLRTTGLTATVRGRYGDSLNIRVQGVDAQGHAGPMSVPSRSVRFVAPAPTGGSGSGSTSAGAPPAFDFNGDGRAELVWSSPDSGVEVVGTLSGARSVLYGQVAAASPTRDPGWVAAASGDFDGDGRSDLLMRNVVTGDNAIWLMNGSTPRAKYTLQNIQPGCDARAADFDGDGRSDILWRCDSIGYSGMWLMKGRKIAFGENLPYMGPPWSIRALADFDGDGRADILWQRPDTGQSGIWLMNGTTPAFVVGVPLADPYWTVGALGDYDGDGDPDILWRGAGGETAVWVMDGPEYSSHDLLDVDLPPDWTVVRSGDYNGDGRDDVLVQSVSTGRSKLLMMDRARVVDQVDLVAAPAWPASR